MKLDTSILKDVFKIRSNWLLFLQGLPGSMPWGVYTIYLHNILCIERKFSIDLASSLILVFGIGAALGSAVAGVICSFLQFYWKSMIKQMFLQQVPIARSGECVLFPVTSSYFVTIPVEYRFIHPNGDSPFSGSLLPGTASQYSRSLYSHDASECESAAVSINSDCCE